MNWIWAALTAILCLVTFVWGEARRSEREDQRYSKLVGDDASQRTALRMLYAALGYEFPDLWETPEPQPSRWDRLVARVTTVGGSVRARFSRSRGAPINRAKPVKPVTVESEPVAVEEGEIPPIPSSDGVSRRDTSEVIPDSGPDTDEWDEADYRRQADADMAALTARINAEPDTGPDTDEMPAVPGPATVPMAAAIDDDWQRQSEARYQQMLAEIRGETEKEQAA